MDIGPQERLDREVAGLIDPCPPGMIEEQVWEQRTASIRKIIEAHGKTLTLTGPLSQFYSDWYGDGYDSALVNKIEKELHSYPLPIDFSYKNSDNVSLATLILLTTDATVVNALMRRPGFVKAVEDEMPMLTQRYEELRNRDWMTYWEMEENSRLQFERMCLDAFRVWGYAKQIVQNVGLIKTKYTFGIPDEVAIAYLRRFPHTYKLSRKTYPILERTLLRLARGDKEYIFRYCHGSELEWGCFVRPPLADSLLGKGGYCVATKIQCFVDGRWTPWAKLKLLNSKSHSGVRGTLAAACDLSGLRAVPVCRKNPKSGQLWQYLPRALHDLKNQVPEEFMSRISVLADAAYDLAAAHEIGAAHRDVKPANILVFPDEIGALADWGFYTNLATDTKIQGTPLYQPDEVVNREADWSIKSWQQSDLFGLGATIFEVMYGTRFYDLRGKATGEGKHKRVGPYLEERWTKVERPKEMDPELDARMQALCKELLGSPGERPAARQIADELQGIVEDWRAYSVNPPSLKKSRRKK